MTKTLTHRIKILVFQSQIEWHDGQCDIEKIIL